MHKQFIRHRYNKRGDLHLPFVVLLLQQNLIHPVILNCSVTFPVKYQCADIQKRVKTTDIRRQNHLPEKELFFKQFRFISTDMQNTAIRIPRVFSHLHNAIITGGCVSVILVPVGGWLYFKFLSYYFQPAVILCYIINNYKRVFAE